MLITTLVFASIFAFQSLQSILSTHVSALEAELSEVASQSVSQLLSLADYRD
jgi:hypothetical protein